MTRDLILGLQERLGLSAAFSLSQRLDARRAAMLAIGIGTIAGVIAWALMARPNYASDFFHYWIAARTLLHGGDPYVVIPAGPLNPGQVPLFYPLPALLLLLPLAPLPLAVAGGVFMGLSSALAAWGVARTGIERLPLFLSASFVLSLSLGQWSPLMLAAALVPAIAPVIVAKPNLGLSVWVARPLVKTAVVGALLIVVSFIVLPNWPREWLTNISGREEKFIPLLRPAGFLLLLSLMGWRRPEGRLLSVLSVVPQALFFYDQLLLALVCRTLRQSLVFALCSNVVFLGWRHWLKPGDLDGLEAVPWAYALYGVALAMLLWNLVRDRQAKSATTPDKSAPTQPLLETAQL